MAKAQVRDLLRAQVRGTFRMADVDPASTPGFKGGDKKALREVKTHRNELFELHERLYAERKRSLLVILQGTDAEARARHPATMSREH